MIFHSRDSPWENFTQDKPFTEILGGENFRKKFYEEGGFPV